MGEIFRGRHFPADITLGELHQQIKTETELEEFQQGFKAKFHEENGIRQLNAQELIEVA